MRIIAGLAKGRRLVSPRTPDTRPVTDRAREAIFSSLGERVTGAVVADLYAGSGAFGLEALSRGAVSARFVERSRAAVEALRANVETVGLGGEVLMSDVGDFLSRDRGRYDLVFMDPPWDLATSIMEVEMTALDPLLASSATVIVSRRHTDEIPDPPETWRLAADKRYGDTRILKYSKGEGDR